MAARTTVKKEPKTQMEDALEQGQAQLTEAVEAGQAQMKTMIEQNQKLMVDGFNLWKDYTTIYAEMMVGVTQLTVNQGVAYRESLHNMVADNLKQVETLAAKQQELALNSLELFTEHTKTSYERAGKLFTPVAN